MNFTQLLIIKAGLNPGFSGWVGLEILTNCDLEILTKNIIVFMYMTKTSIPGAKYGIWANPYSQNLFLKFWKDFKNFTHLT